MTPRRREQAAPEEAWIVSLRRALLAHGVTAGDIAAVIAAALRADRTVRDGETVSTEPHHGIRLRAAAMAAEVFAPKQQREQPVRVMLEFPRAAHLEMEMVMFGGPPEGTPTLPEPGPVERVPTQTAPAPRSKELTAHLIRQGQLRPDGSPVVAETRAQKALPEGKAMDAWHQADGSTEPREIE